MSSFIGRLVRGVFSLIGVGLVLVVFLAKMDKARQADEAMDQIRQAQESIERAKAAERKVDSADAVLRAAAAREAARRADELATRPAVAHGGTATRP